MKQDFPFRDVGNKLKLLRGDVTQKVFAEAIGVSERVYQRYEYGERLPTLETFIKISACCDISLLPLIQDIDKRSLSKQQKRQIQRLEAGFQNLGAFLESKGADFLKELDKVSKIKKSFKHKLGIPRQIDFWLSDPRFAEATDKLGFIFAYGTEEVIDSILEILRATLHVVSQGQKLSNLPVEKKSKE